MSYNFGDDVYLDTFIYNLSISAKFASIAAIACAEHNIGRKNVKAFVKDLQTNIRGINIATTSEKYWTEFL